MNNIDRLEKIIMEMPASEYKKLSKELLKKKRDLCTHPNDVFDNTGILMDTWHCPDCGRYDDNL